jgi:hypothetical protein
VPPARARPAPGRGRGQRRHLFALVGEPVVRPAAQRLVDAGVRLAEPGVELELVVELVGELAAGFEVRLEVALQALDDALPLRLRLRLMALLGSELFV